MENEHKRDAAPAATVETRCALHPERVAAGTCGRCGNYYCDACTGWRNGGESQCKACSESRTYVAWEDRSLGIWDRYCRTLRSSLVDLPRFAGELPAKGSLWLALIFAILPTLIAAMLGSALATALFSWLATSLRSTAEARPAVLLASGVMLVTYTLLGLFAYLAYLLAWPLLLLLVARVLSRPELTYRGALRCLCYASGFNWLYCIPLIGLTAAVYHLIVASYCLGAMSRSSWLTGFAIYVLPTMVCGLGACGTYFAVIITMMGSQH
jgi:hypothetical protein